MATRPPVSKHTAALIVFVARLLARIDGICTEYHEQGFTSSPSLVLVVLSHMRSGLSGTMAAFVLDKCGFADLDHALPRREDRHGTQFAFEGRSAGAHDTRRVTACSSTSMKLNLRPHCASLRKWLTPHGPTATRLVCLISVDSSSKHRHTSC